MFLGGIPRRPNKATAYKTLKTHAAIWGASAVILRVTPFFLQFLTQEKELKLEF